MRKFIYGGLLASTMLVPAFAQNTPPASSTPSAQPSTPPASSTTVAPKAATVAPKAQGDMWRSSKLIGLNVYNDQNEKLGDISEILLDKSGKVDGIVIGVGGFLGMGRHDILVKMDKLKFVNEPAKTTTSTSPSGTTGSGAGGSSSRPATSPSASSASATKASKWYPDHAVLSGATKESLKSMAEFKFD
jgi:sporulation protein YlmC with PRC-barrel domain